ncbi:MAG: RnfABCDGE type electron transport complex subunit D [Candidatus Krumholzibacteria bacterium]|nr:RnfABCDGE type electron transport complex subunit D [Candidatus Krumholzibacteria bacterium]
MEDGKPEGKPAKKKEKVGPRFLVSSSPHLHEGRTVSGIMKLVIYALIPATFFSIYIFGLAALWVILISVGSAVIFELLTQKIMKRPVTIKDHSAVLTGLLLALNLPSTSPWWMILVGTFFAIVIAKQIYGGLGYNPFNPALVGRVVLLISFPVQMTARWVSPSGWGMDAVTTATPLGKIRETLMAFGHIEDPHLTRQEIIDFLIGNRAGSLGEISVILLVAGGIFLIAKKVISWHTPVAFIGTVWIFTGIFHMIDPTHYVDPCFHVITGGLFLGAVFMATDYVTSPISGGGMFIFGAGCGIFTVVIRLFGSYPEGVSFAILLMNAATPLIDRYTRPAVFGATGKGAAG